MQPNSCLLADVQKFRSGPSPLVTRSGFGSRTMASGLPLKRTREFSRFSNACTMRMSMKAPELDSLSFAKPSNEWAERRELFRSRKKGVDFGSSCPEVRLRAIGDITLMADRRSRIARFDEILCALN